MKAKASICISEDGTLISSLEIARDRIQVMIDKGMDNHIAMLQGLVDIANARIAQIKSGEKPALAPDATAKYAAEVVVDLDQIDEPKGSGGAYGNSDIIGMGAHIIPFMIILG